MNTRSIALFCFLTLCLGAPLSAQGEPKIAVEKDIVYSRIGDTVLRMDIAYPQQQGAHPAVVCVHGGAWRFGQRQDLDRVIESLAEWGYVAASISYRLLPEGKFPDAIVDCKTAVRFLRAHADRFHIDKDHIGAIGFSAGAYLVCMLGVTQKDAGFDGNEYPEQSCPVQAVVSYFAPTDLGLYRDDESAMKSTFEPLLGARFKDDPEIYKKASPITYVSKKAAPFLFLHGTKDWIVPIDHSRSMCKKLKDVGVEADIIEVEGEAHGWKGAQSRRTWLSVFKFLEQHLKQ